MKSLRTAVVGCGGIAQTHAEVLSTQATAQVVAYADVKLERAKALAKKYGGNAYGSMEELLDREQVDVVHGAIGGGARHPCIQ